MILRQGTVKIMVMTIQGVTRGISKYLTLLLNALRIYMVLHAGV